MSEETHLDALPPELSPDEWGEIPGADGQAPPTRQFCVFRSGRERFCLPVLEVEEVVDWPMMTRVPLSPPFLMGIFNLRGTIIPVVDIAVTEGRRPGLLPRSVIVAVLAGDGQSESMHLGIAADEVVGTYPAFSDSQLDHSPPDMPHCRGMLRHDERLALILDLRQLIRVFSVPVI
ncbi:MAG TPA: chemotaxis protein CheW [Candidatus Acidoferrales bacterium]|nr:chemotaxis protein CheW [Candidatus Acidoferrales bacterium]